PFVFGRRGSLGAADATGSCFTIRRGPNNATGRGDCQPQTRGCGAEAADGRLPQTVRVSGAFLLWPCWQTRKQTLLSCSITFGIPHGGKQSTIPLSGSKVSKAQSG